MVTGRAIRKLVYLVVYLQRDTWLTADEVDKDPRHHRRAFDRTRANWCRRTGRAPEAVTGV